MKHAMKTAQIYTDCIGEIHRQTQRSNYEGEPADEGSKGDESSCESRHVQFSRKSPVRFDAKWMSGLDQAWTMEENSIGRCTENKQSTREDGILMEHRGMIIPKKGEEGRAHSV